VQLLFLVLTWIFFLCNLNQSQCWIIQTCAIAFSCFILNIFFIIWRLRAFNKLALRFFRSLGQLEFQIYLYVTALCYCFLQFECNSIWMWPNELEIFILGIFVCEKTTTFFFKVVFFVKTLFGAVWIYFSLSFSHCAASWNFSKLGVKLKCNPKPSC